MSHNEVLLGQVNPSHNRCLGKKKEFGLEGTHGRRPRMLETEVSVACLGNKGPIGSAATTRGWRKQGGAPWLETWGEAGLAYACISDAWPRELWEEAGIV